ncbi:hypothetical protein ACJX0J_031122, partial [Zea mays]
CSHAVITFTDIDFIETSSLSCFFIELASVDSILEVGEKPTVLHDEFIHNLDDNNHPTTKVIAFIMGRSIHDNFMLARLSIYADDVMCQAYLGICDARCTLGSFSMHKDKKKGLNSAIILGACLGLAEALSVVLSPVLKKLYIGIIASSNKYLPVNLI